MKKLMVFVLAAMMAVGFAGTAMAANTVELGGTAPGVFTTYYGAVYSTAPGGASAYVSTGSVFVDPTKAGEAGTTLYAISNTLTNAAGTEMLAQKLQWDSGATAVGGPQLVSGTSDTVILYVLAATDVGSVATNGGNTLYAINGGTGAQYWATGIPANGIATAALAAGAGAMYDNAYGAMVGIAGAIPFSMAPVTIDSESIATSGATIYGVTSGIGEGDTGVSVWAIDANTGAFTTNATGMSNVTGFIGTGGSGVSVIHAAPVVSGNSVFFVGYAPFVTGISIYQFDKNNIWAGPKAVATVGMNADASDSFVPTPCVAGNSIFVVDNNGAVTAFYKANLAPQYSVDYAAGSDTGVTASPVTDGTYIFLSSTSSVSCYTLNKLSTNVPEWRYSFGAGKSIDATPAISNGYVWVTVNDNVLGLSTTYRFKLSDGTLGQVGTYGQPTYASPIIVSDSVWTVSYDPEVTKIADGFADGWPFWTQFKFDAAKTGANTEDEEDVVPGSTGGCFISTVK